MDGGVEEVFQEAVVEAKTPAAAQKVVQVVDKVEVRAKGQAERDRSKGEVKV